MKVQTNKATGIIIGILVLAVIILTGLVGYLYGQNLITSTQTVTITQPITQTQTKTETSFQTTTVTVTTTSASLEQLVISSGYAKSSTQVYLNVRNTGPTDFAIVDIFVNQRPIALAPIPGTPAPAMPISMKSGDSTLVVLSFGSALNSGVTYEIALVTSSGAAYSKLIVVP